MLIQLSAKIFWPIVNRKTTLRNILNISDIFLKIDVSVGGGPSVFTTPLRARSDLFVLGMLLDWIPILYITLPVFIPIVEQMGWGPLWFALLAVVCLQTSWLTPPIGFALFFLRGIAPPGVSYFDVVKGCFPFMLCQLLGLALLILFPQIIVFLPDLVMPQGQTMAPSSLRRLSETGLQLWAQRLPISSQVLLGRMDIVKASMAGSEMNCSTQKSSTAWGKHKSSSKNGDITTTLRDHTVHWAIVHQHPKPSYRCTKDQSCTNNRLVPIRLG